MGLTLTPSEPWITLNRAIVGAVMARSDATDVFLARDEFQKLIDRLRHEGYRCIGPQVRDDTIVYDDLERADQLPVGVHQVQQPGYVRIEPNADQRCFAWANGPQGLRPWLFVPREILWRVVREADGALQFHAESPAPEPLAVIGVRACDLAALALHDAHFLNGGYVDPGYAARRQALLLIAVNCTHPAQTCFCASTGDGPRAQAGYDLALDELAEGYLVRAGTARGIALLAQLPGQPASAPQSARALAQSARAAETQTRRLPGNNLGAALFANLEHPRWHDVASRCLACGNCTSVCPTCFCHRETDQPALDGASSEHVREWDSCFTAGHSFLAGKPLRADTRLRYRQWLTHKHGAWHDQYGRSGCVGCGRCIAWCPVGIDITEELAAICT